MAFDFSTLVTDRKQSDVAYVKQLIAKIVAGTETEAELAEWKSFTLKGSYNYTDLNRVTAAMEALKAKLEGYGYAVPGYQRIKVPHVLPEPEPTSKLPEGYTELTHIESTGTQYIDTGFKPNSNTRIVADMEITTGTTSFLFGARHNSSANSTSYSFSVVQISGTSLRSDFGSVETAISVSPVQRLNIDKNGNTTTVNGTSVTATAQSFSGSYNLALFTVNTAGTINSTKTSAKLYSCQIYDNDTLVRDYIPCINPDGSVGLYDLVTSAFFGNSGTGSFVAGAIPRELPDGYTQVEYIQSTGTQYIDTNYVPASENLKIYAKFAISKIQSWKSMFGSENGANGPWSLIAITNDSSKLVFYTGTSSMVGSIPVSAGQVYELTCQTANGTLTYNCGSTTGSVAVSGSVNKAQTLYVFTQHSHNSSNTANQAISMKLYDCKIYDNGTLTRDFVPCKNSGGIFGLYDLVNNVFYQNAGTGTFTAGNEIAPPTDVPSVDVPSVDEYDPYLWYEFDWPTPETMTIYLLNVSVIRSVLTVMASTPKVPSDMVELMVTEANDIEVILLDVYRQINIMATTFIPCGEALCGGDNL